MKQFLLQSLAAIHDPQTLSVAIYRECKPLAAVSKIDLICSGRDAQRFIACFVETGSADDARRLAHAFGASLFGTKTMVFEIPRPDGFICDGYRHSGDAAMPACVVFNCLES